MLEADKRKEDQNWNKTEQKRRSKQVFGLIDAPAPKRRRKVDEYVRFEGEFSCCSCWVNFFLIIIYKLDWNNQARSSLFSFLDWIENRLSGKVILNKLRLKLCYATRVVSCCWSSADKAKFNVKPWSAPQQQQQERPVRVHSLQSSFGLAGLTCKQFVGPVKKEKQSRERTFSSLLFGAAI